MNKQNKLYLY